MHFETHTKENSIGLQEDGGDLDYLQRIYVRIDASVDLEVSHNIYTKMLNRNQEILGYDAAGQWEMAEGLYEVKTFQGLSNFFSCMRCINYLKKVGDYVK
jgi:hypothetical protein